MIDKGDIREMSEKDILSTANVNLYLLESKKTKTTSLSVYELNIHRDVIEQIRLIAKDYFLLILDQAKSLGKLPLYNPDTGQEPFKICSKQVGLFKELYPYVSGQKPPTGYDKSKINDEKVRSWIFRFEVVVDGKIEQILFFQRFQPSKMLGSKGVTMFEHGKTFKLLGDHILNFNLVMDLMYYQDTLVVTKMPSFEHIFGYEEYYRKNAVTLVQDLSLYGLAGLKFKIFDIGAVDDKIFTNTRLAHKLYSASVNRYYTKIDYKKLQCLNKKYDLHLNLNKQTQEWIIDDKSDLQIMAQILNDDYELSQLTDNEYIAIGKEQLN